MARLANGDGWQITHQHLTTLVDLSTAGPATGIAFAPCHPVFCQDTSDFNP
jgi:hypothetical protein